MDQLRSKGNPLISGKSRLVKYYILARCYVGKLNSIQYIQLGFLSFRHSRLEWKCQGATATPQNRWTFTHNFQVCAPYYTYLVLTKGQKCLKLSFEPLTINDFRNPSSQWNLDASPLPSPLCWRPEQHWKWIQEEKVGCLSVLLELWHLGVWDWRLKMLMCWDVLLVLDVNGVFHPYISRLFSRSRKQVKCSPTYLTIVNRSRTQPDKPK